MTPNHLYIRVEIDGQFSEGSTGHLTHFLKMAPLLPADIQPLLHLPEQDAGREEEEEAAEEDGKKHEEVDVRLVLAEEEQALRLPGTAGGVARKQQVKAAVLQGVQLVGVCDDHSVSDPPDKQHRLLIADRDVGDQTFGTFLAKPGGFSDGGPGAMVQGGRGEGFGAS